MYDKWIERFRTFLAALLFGLFCAAILGVFYLICVAYVGLVKFIEGLVLGMG